MVAAQVVHSPLVEAVVGVAALATVSAAVPTAGARPTVVVEWRSISEPPQPVRLRPRTLLLVHSQPPRCTSERTGSRHRLVLAVAVAVAEGSLAVAMASAAAALREPGALSYALSAGSPATSNERATGC
jgi:hypothetical protein